MNSLNVETTNMPVRFVKISCFIGIVMIGLVHFPLHQQNKQTNKKQSLFKHTPTNITKESRLFLSVFLLIYLDS